VELLERGRELDTLRACLEAAGRRSGRMVLLAGEAGGGKTALVDAFCADLDGVRVARGACDPLSTPRPLGPFTDIAARLGGDLVDLVASAAPGGALFRGFLDVLRQSRGVTVAVVEDAHWGDEATFDMLRFLGRRLEGVPALFVVTYRDDEVGSQHPLRVALGDLATAEHLVRVHVPRLSRDAVATLAAPHGADPDVLYRQTGGNPFFVTEVLHAGGGVPETVRDAVLARASRLSPDARTVLEAAAMVPTRVELWLLDALVASAADAVDECMEAGMLVSEDPLSVSFRHELARHAVEQSLSPARRTALHARAGRLLAERGDADPARVAHHAEQAGEPELARDAALAAGRRAASLGAHREAAAQFARALRHAEGLEQAALAGLLEDYSTEASITESVAAALDAAQRAVALREELGDTPALATALGRLSNAQWGAGRSREAEATAQRAVALLEPAGPTAELAAAYADVATYCMLARDLDGTLRWADRAIALAEQVDASAALARALNSRGSIRIINALPGGQQDLERSIAIAQASDRERLEAVGWSNLGSGSGEVRDYPVAEQALQQAVAFAEERDLDASRDYAQAWLARVRFEQGRWEEAAVLAETLPLDRPGTSPVVVVTALAVLGRLRVRRGEPGAERLLDRAWRLASQTGDLQRLWPVAAARAEAAWLAGDEDAIPALVRDTFDSAVEHAHPWAAGELGLWLQRAGALPDLPEGAAEPYALQLRGARDEAAAAWQRLGCPYEAADALADGEDEAALREALAVFDRLGAPPAAVRVRRRLRELGVTAVPRGPRPATAGHPAGLTPRQAEVLELVAEGLTDAEIAERLFISPKTVGHHVSALLDKLGAGSRTEAARRARAQGLLSQAGEAESPT
jgi:DNA-binding CsgD family transcriptional regulator/tetratricopeptide (TPR) repeat protein